MGSDRFYPEERPVRDVSVGPFAIDRHPVTIAEFRRFVKATGHVTWAEWAPAAEDYPDAEYGFLLHDAGKVGIPERILSKPGPLTAAEWRVMRTHPLIGYQMVSSIPFLKGAAEIVRYHHEMFDGSGYPEALKGEEIPMPARVFSVVDAFDAMTTDRPYRAALPLEYAAEEIERMGGTQFDPDVAKVFAPLCERLVPITTSG